MKLKWWMVGCIGGILFSFILIITSKTESIFIMPIGIILSFLCLFGTCSDLVGRAIATFIFIFLFYIGLGLFIGLIFDKIKKT